MKRPFELVLAAIALIGLLCLWSSRATVRVVGAVLVVADIPAMAVYGVITLRRASRGRSRRD